MTTIIKDSGTAYITNITVSGNSGTVTLQGLSNLSSIPVHLQNGTIDSYEGTAGTYTVNFNWENNGQGTLSQRDDTPNTDLETFTITDIPDIEMLNAGGQKSRRPFSGRPLRRQMKDEQDHGKPRPRKPRQRQRLVSR